MYIPLRRVFRIVLALCPGGLLQAQREPAPTTTPPPQSPSGGGGGSISGAVLALLALLRRPGVNRRTAKAESGRHDRRVAPQRWSWKQSAQI